LLAGYDALSAPNSTIPESLRQIILMIRRRPITTIILLILIISGSIAAMIWGNLQYTRTYPGGEQFLVDWFSARAVLELSRT